MNVPRALRCRHRNQSSVSFCTPATLTAPILLKWMLVWEHPVSHTLWLGKAVPRVWLSEGETVSVQVIGCLVNKNQTGRVKLFLFTPVGVGAGRWHGVRESVHGAALSYRLAKHNQGEHHSR